ncbi:MAG: putative hydro-lyase [Rhodospirillaceae bacterium]|nr:putative hydro-lyase [Rhodospirillaceae bacterium]
MSAKVHRLKPAAREGNYLDGRPKTPADARALVRSGKHPGHTTGFAPGYMQGNLVILPAENALDFFRYCQRNPKPCPLVGVSETGDPMMRTLGKDVDIRTDIGSYNIFRDGELIDQVSDIKDLWGPDSVAFILGCSFTFEQALIDGGIPLRHWSEDLTVSMYHTNLETVPAGPFGGGMVVSMRPMTSDNAIKASAICARYPDGHGAPVHLGDPAEIGIDDFDNPPLGDPQPLRAGEIPVFWACGVTPQRTVVDAKLPLVITHTPGSMLVTDIPANQG